MNLPGLTFLAVLFTLTLGAAKAQVIPDFLDNDNYRPYLSEVQKQQVIKQDLLKQNKYPRTSLIIDNEKKCEFNLPAMYNVDVSEIKVFPVNDKVMRYFSGIFFTDWLKE